MEDQDMDIKNNSLNYYKEENESLTISSNEINDNFNLYKPVKEGLLAFNLSKKNYFTVIPEKYEEFWNEYESEGSLQYNTLEGLFVINSKNNQLYYYSSKKNMFCELFAFKENHSFDCICFEGP